VRRVVSNTGPLLHLHESDLLTLLEHAGEIHIPRAVDLEMVQHELDWQTLKPNWITVTQVTTPFDAQSAKW
jgi:hypothetical protein